MRPYVSTTSAGATPRKGCSRAETGRKARWIHSSSSGDRLRSARKEDPCAEPSSRRSRRHPVGRLGARRGCGGTVARSGPRIVSAAVRGSHSRCRSRESRGAWVGRSGLDPRSCSLDRQGSDRQNPDAGRTKAWTSFRLLRPTPRRHVVARHAPRPAPRPRSGPSLGRRHASSGSGRRWTPQGRKALFTPSKPIRKARGVAMTPSSGDALRERAGGRRTMRRLSPRRSWPASCWWPRRPSRVRREPEVSAARRSTSTGRCTGRSARRRICPGPAPRRRASTRSTSSSACSRQRGDGRAGRPRLQRRPVDRARPHVRGLRRRPDGVRREPQRRLRQRGGGRRRDRGRGRRPTSASSRSSCAR